MENFTISNLITEIKNNNEKSNKLRSSITQQKEDLMDKIRVALEDEGLKLQPKYPNNTDIYISEDTGFVLTYQQSTIHQHHTFNS
jgi:hypothetical protein